jgi:hypothetical protein
MRLRITLVGPLLSGRRGSEEAFLDRLERVVPAMAGEAAEAAEAAEVGATGAESLCDTGGTQRSGRRPNASRH